MKRRRTDYGTVILHWILVAALGVAFVTGLRIASEKPQRTWINLFDHVLPHQAVWTTHMQAAAVLIAVSIAYAIYIIRSGLGRRVQLDRTRLRGLGASAPARWGAVNVLLYWVFFATILALIITGELMYLGYSAGYDTATLHWYGSWIILAFAGLHVLVHYGVGGASQLLRILRPSRLSTPPPPLDAGELLTLLVEQTHANEAHRQRTQATSEADRLAAERGPSDSRARNLTSQSNPFVVAIAVAIVGTMAILALDRQAIDSLRVHRISSIDAPILDGDTSDRVWRGIRPFSVVTSQGGNFDGKGETRVEIRAVHDGTWAYFLFTWDDPTRSLKQLPLIKGRDGWQLLHDGYESGDEYNYNEDKFSVLLTTSDGILAGDNTFHAGPHPIPQAPATMTGRGLHYTEGGGYVDVWQWKATSSGSSGWMDDAHFGPPLSATPAQMSNAAPYRGGFAPDPGAGNYFDNFLMVEDVAGGKRSIRPRRLPNNLAATTASLGLVSLDPNHGESEGARWFLTEAESSPYSPELDSRIPDGTIIPGVVVAGAFSGDRADARCAARWASGRWALEVARRLDTHSKYDVAIATGVYMRVAAFDHSQIRHTRHVRPIHLEVE